MSETPIFSVPPERRRWLPVSDWSFIARFSLLNIGLLLYGAALAGMIRADVGLAPWDALHVGLSRIAPGLTVGMASIGIGFICLIAANLAFKMPVGIGSILNMILIGIYLDFIRAWIPVPMNLWVAWAMFLVSVLGVGIATGMYIASDFGAGPRDSLVLGLARRACRMIEEAGAAFVKTSTGFAVPAAGIPVGATIADVQLLRASVSEDVEVKASGGIRTLSEALALLEAGASRLGTSSGITLLEAFRASAAS